MRAGNTLFGTKPARIACNVAVSCYEQVRFLPRMLDGLLLQQTEAAGDFPALTVNVFLFDDASRDGSQALLARALPGRNRHIRAQRMFAGENGGMYENLRRILRFLRGRREPYAMILEGDDWWSDARLLQKRVAAMEAAARAGRQCSMCFNALLLYEETENRFSLHSDQAALRSDFLTATDLAQGNPIANFSAAMWRTDALRALPDDLFELNFADWLLHFLLAQQGEILYLNEPMSVYRIHPHGVYSGRRAAAPAGESNATRSLRYLLAKYPGRYDEPLHRFAAAFGIPWPDTEGAAGTES